METEQNACYVKTKYLDIQKEQKELEAYAWYTTRQNMPEKSKQAD